MKNFKKILTLGVAGMLLAASMAGCSGSPKQNSSSTSPSPSPAVDNSLEDIKAKGKMVVGLDDQVPPMGFRDEDTNEIVGIDIDLAKAVAEKLGVEVEFKPIDWKTKEAELSSKKIDMIWNGFTITEQRLEEMTFSKPYMDNTQAIAVNEGSEIKTMEDLAGKKVGIQASSSVLEAIEAKGMTEKIGEDNFQKYDTMLQAIMDLELGRCDAVVADETVLRYTITKAGKNQVILDENFGEEEYGIGFRKGEEKFAAAVDAALDELKEEGKAGEICTAWFGKDIIKR